MWSAGCVLAELLAGEPFFAGDSSMLQLHEIIRKLGTPTTEDLAAMNPNYQPKKKLPKAVKPPTETLFPKETEPSSFDLLNKLLIYNPQKRLTAL